MPAIHSVLVARGAAPAASAVGVAPGGGGLDGEALHDLLTELTTGRPWRPTLSSRRRRTTVLPGRLPTGSPTATTLGVGGVADCPATAVPLTSGAAVYFNGRSAAARRVRRKATASAENLGDYRNFLQEQAPEPPAAS